ncbi:E3 ubiquitin-protein ligase SIS3 isoform X5 [Physcomitrium patens]|uniref:E3 ubiquitin-protein ligase SIS3 isoform X5 n=3 Tax=Physcomitrium patens TaxID=3218 RepID=UPI003CCDA8F2
MILVVSYCRFDGFFLSMLATSVIVVLVNWQRYLLCRRPLHIWIVVDYATVFLFRILMFIDSGLASGMGPEATQMERMLRFKGRLFVLSVLSFVFYPFLWMWTILGSLWFSDTQGCLPEEGQKWGFLIWLVFSYCGLVCLACITAGKWLLHRQSRLASPPNGQSAISEFQMFLEMIRFPEWTSRHRTNAVMMRTNDLAVFPPGFVFSQGHNAHTLQATQRERVERAIQGLHKFSLSRVAENWTQCPICLDDFDVGNEVRTLPCTHTFHVACIDAWLRLNVKCPHCRSSVFPELELDRSNIPALPRLIPSRSRHFPSNHASDLNHGAVVVSIPRSQTDNPRPQAPRSTGGTGAHIMTLADLASSSVRQTPR